MKARAPTRPATRTVRLAIAPLPAAPESLDLLVVPAAAAFPRPLLALAAVPVATAPDAPLPLPVAALVAADDGLTEFQYEAWLV